MTKRHLAVGNPLRRGLNPPTHVRVIRTAHPQHQIDGRRRCDRAAADDTAVDGRPYPLIRVLVAPQAEVDLVLDEERLHATAQVRCH